MAPRLLLILKQQARQQLQMRVERLRLSLFLPMGSRRREAWITSARVVPRYVPAFALLNLVVLKEKPLKKIYRHPNCLNKHRWEHTRQWREASKFVLSKHQQVQLLEVLFSCYLFLDFIFLTT